MIDNIKLDFFESLNILNNLAKKNKESFPNDLCLFLSNELNLKNVLIYEENGENNFNRIGKTSNMTDVLLPATVEVKNYNKFIDELKFSGIVLSECEININIQNENFEIIIFNFNDTKLYLLVLIHKILPSPEDRDKYYTIAKFVRSNLGIWKNFDSFQTVKEISNYDLIISTSKGLQKELKTINGLFTLAKEENPTNTINKYLDQIKILHQFISSTIDDLNQFLTLDQQSLKLNKSNVAINDFWEKFYSQKVKELPNYKLKISNNINSEFIFDENILFNLLSLSVNYCADLSQSNSTEIQASIVDNKLHFRIISKNAKIAETEISTLNLPFSKRENLENVSGISIILLNKIVNLLDGTLKFTIQNADLYFNISLPIENRIQDPSQEILRQNSYSVKDQILVIESDSTSSTLLNKHLSKWNYKTEIVNSGEAAFSLIQQNKYIAVILNIEQENENSLELIQKIKNNEATKHTPVIAFSMEAENEKIYLMGSVEYLVKPINYNNLVEILTSYKLRRNSTVLCVDDDQPTLNLVKQAVQTAGFNVVAEYRSEIVLDLISDKDLDLAIIDLDMPKLNGFDLIKLIKSEDRFSKLPIIIYTGKEDYQQDLEKIDGMFNDLLDKKSTSFNDLEKAITSMIESYEEPKPIEEIKEKGDSPIILMAEDYKHSQIIVTRLLKKNGYDNIVVVENGEEALEICINEKVDLILMDMQMPVMNGFEATGKIRELKGYADTPIIALTAFAMKGDREKCLEAGATDYIPKPIDSKEFIEKVKYYTQVNV